MLRRVLSLLLLGVTVLLSAQEAERSFALSNYNRYYQGGDTQKDAAKEQAIKEYRNYYARTPYRKHSLETNLTWQECQNLINDEGRFTDMLDDENLIVGNGYPQSMKFDDQQQTAGFIIKAFNRLWNIAEAYRNKQLPVEEALTEKYCKAILHYGNIEIGRNNYAHRFHGSCFSIPTASINTYFCFLEEMDKVESGEIQQPLLNEVCVMLKMIGLQSWTQPLRHDATDENIVSVERFRNHVWWVGGNALAYRSLLPCAFMMSSSQMVDVLAEVAQKSISNVSQNTYHTAFWNEGFTADGAGWGHGMQCLIWGYPIDGTNNALAMLNVLKSSPWDKKLDRENIEALFNFLQGGSWYYYKGYIPPSLDRYSAVYYREKKNYIPFLNMLQNLLDNWRNSFTDEELKELEQLAQEVDRMEIHMNGYPQGKYTGTRWFFNNDDLIKTNNSYYIQVNMASARCDGLESATGFADEYNFCTADGQTLLQKNGDEYRKIIGAWDVTALPGITARRGMEQLTPVTNWRGYCSRHNFAGAATRGGENAVAGYIFEKMDASEKDGVNDKGTLSGINTVLYNLKAYKSYFMLNDYLIALGAGVSNFDTSLPGNIHTIIDQTAWESEVYFFDGKEKQILHKGTHEFPKTKKLTWLVQEEGFAYTILSEYSKKLTVKCEEKNNEWEKRNKTNLNIQDLPERARILHLWTDHGHLPVNDTYGYVVYCGEGLPPALLDFNVLRNDTTIQAIQSKDKKVTQAVFYSPEEKLSAKKLSLKVSAPAVVMIEDMGDEYIIMVNDPAMNPGLSKIDIEFNKRNITIDLPQGKWAGKPAIVHLRK